MKNKINGTQFERRIADELHRRGFWVHRLQDNQNGQPFDIIACRNGKSYAIDCKDCQGRYFFFRRIEENQRHAMQLWLDTGNADPLFVIRFPLALNGELIRVVSYEELMKLEKEGSVQISATTAILCGWDLDERFGEAIDGSNDQQ